MEQQQIERMHQILLDLGMHVVENENFKNTPTRFLKYLEHYLQPFNAKDVLSTTFPLASGTKTGTHVEGKFDAAMVVQGPIPYRAVCAHHLLPVIGTVHIGYLPTARVVGLSKLSRLVYGHSHSTPGLQEDVCHAITNSLMTCLDAIGAICIIKAEHGCMAARGVEEVGVQTTTTSLKGVFTRDADARQEFYAMIRT